MRRVVVFGNTGMVGRAVLATLSALEGIDPVPVSRHSRGFDAQDASDNLPRLLGGAAFSVNCIGLLRSNPAYGTSAFQHTATLINSIWPQRLAATASDLGCRVIHLSTDAVFSPGLEPADEVTPVSPSEVYGVSKALGEVHDDNVLNVRFSVIGPAPDRAPSLWEWLVRQPSNAVVPGYITFGWTGCTSVQLASFVSDLIIRDTFDRVRSQAPACHFVPNGSATKFDVLTLLARRLRPDIDIVPQAQPAPTSRVLRSSLEATEPVYSGTRGWDASIDQAANAAASLQRNVQC